MLIFRKFLLSYKSSKASLSERAGLTFVSTFLLQVARFTVSFVVTPIVIRSLGAELYGAWRMMQQSIGYLSLTDLRPMGTLKFTLAVKQHIEDVEEKKRQIGSALKLWAITLPIFVTCGVILVWQVPNFIKVQPLYVKPVRIAIGILISGIALERVISLPDNVLRGMNLAYKAMGLNTFGVLLGGAMTILAVWLGFGLPGIAVASVMGIAINGGIRLFIVRKELQWFGASQPSNEEFIKFAKLSAWLFLFGISGILLNSSDILLVGYVLGPSIAAIYAATGLALNMLTKPLMMLLSSATPGLAGLCGKSNWQYVLKVREEMLILYFLGLSLIAVGVILLNNAFLALWIKQSYYAGDLVNILLVYSIAVRALSRVDINIVSSMLELKVQALSSFFSGLVVVSLGWVTLRKWGMSGMAFSCLVGATVFWICNLYIIQRRIDLKFSCLFGRNVVRLLIVFIFLTFFSYLVAQFALIKKVMSLNWTSFVTSSILCLSVCFGLLYVLMGSDIKMVLTARIKNLLGLDGRH